MSNATEETQLRAVGQGIVSELTIGSADIDATLDPVSGRKVGPIVEVLVLSGAGTLAYVDTATGLARTLTGLSATGVSIDGIAIKTINGTGNGAPSAALTLRVRQ